jgi:hypothetical protein
VNKLFSITVEVELTAPLQLWCDAAKKLGLTSIKLVLFADAFILKIIEN